MTKRKPRVGRPKNSKSPGYGDLPTDVLATISARVTDVELQLCRDRARALGLKVSEYLRALVRWDLALWPHDQSSPPSPSSKSPPT